MERINSKHRESEEITGSADQIIKSIISKFNLAIVQPNQVKMDCDKLRQIYKKAVSNSIYIKLESLFPLLQKRSGLIAEYVFSFLEDVAMTKPDSLPLIEALLSARDKTLARKALENTVSLAEKGTIKVTRSFIRFIAGRMDTDNSPFTERASVLKISLLVKNYNPGKRFSHADPLMALYLEEKNLDMRRLAAKVLDNSEKALKRKVVEIILGKRIAAFFLPYLVNTGASYTDLLCFQPEVLPFLMNDFIRSEKIIGFRLLCDIITKIGWNRLNLGFEAQSLTGISIGGSPSFMVSDLEASFLDKCEGAEQTSKQYLITTCGGQVSDEQAGGYENDPITRFRSYNLNHASLLSDFLDIGPLRVEKVRDMIRRMDQIVEDYVLLFNQFSDECAILPGVYQKIRNKITRELDESLDNPQFSADLTRIVQSFEEPHSMGDVRTLHGLKRYLHQQGLSMGFKLVEGGRSPNRSVDILVATEDGIRFGYSKIRFADFESSRQDQANAPKIPFTVKLLIDGFVLQMLRGQEKFPGVDIFCYGNEVHYYFGFRNHPAFLRIDYAPPLRGGMIDLEYFGVSNYEMDQHPNISLDAIKAFFQRIEFEIQIDVMRIHARYDKERALTLGDLCRKARRVFQLASYFMDLDWIIGSLALEHKAKQKVTEAWIDFFLRWGYLPLKNVLTKDRIGILIGLVDGPTGQKERIWSGEGNYTDIYTACPPEGFYTNFL